MLGACSAGQETPGVTITASDFSFDAPSSVASGLVGLHLTNEGAQPHHAQIMRINRGHSLDEGLQALAAEDLGRAFAALTPSGGPAILEPGSATRVTNHLDPGDYAFVCLLIDPISGTSHAALGMVKPFEVTGSASDARPPDTQGDIALTDFDFEIPDGFGGGSIAVRNSGNQFHEMLVLRLGSGVTEAQALAALDPGSDAPRPGSFVGGVQAIPPGATAYLDVEPEAGRYLLVCLVPDPVSGKPHAALGMTAGFEVT